MKKILYYPLLVCALAAGFSSCSKEDDEVTVVANMGQTQLSYSADGVWTQVATNQSFMVNNLLFNHEGEIAAWGLTWKGFTPARGNADFDASTVTNWTSHQFEIPSLGGMSGIGTPYIVGYWDTQENETTPAAVRSCRVSYRKTETSPALPFRPQSVNVELTYYVLDIILHGNAFSRAFIDGDWLKLTAHGVKADGSETATDFYLADYRGEKPEVTFSWTPFDLSGLGEINELYFTMSSSDSGQWGMNTPSFFAIDRLSVIAVLPD
ncbi:MAG: DUF4465 domain-containing protein [Bacteroidales bacterium]|nr:DUF4465 domain-containing protein [Bacteroidales bacterium]